MDLLREKLRAKGHHKAQFGGDSSSTATQNTTNTYTDNRAVSSSDNHSTNTSMFSDNTGGSIAVDRSFNTDSFNTTTTNTNITTTDNGAVSAALASNASNTQAMFALAEKLFSGQKDIVTQNQNLAKDLSSNANAAYAGATSQANGNKTMMLIGVAVVGIVAVMAWKYK